MYAESLYDSIVTAGHLFETNYSPGKNEKSFALRSRPQKIGKTRGIGQADRASGVQGGGDECHGSAHGADEPTDGSYSLESAIELDFNALLKDQGDEEVALDEMKAMSKEELEAQRMMQMRMSRNMTDYEDQVVERTIDDNPMFNTSLRMQSPAPDGHFLRVFGQPNRSDLGDLRDDNASMRQALMMLNGRITHEAARVGDLEPMHALLTGKTADLDAAVKLAYMEIMTRDPTEVEITEGKQVLADAANPLDGMADLRLGVVEL